MMKDANVDNGCYKARKEMTILSPTRQGMGVAKDNTATQVMKIIRILCFPPGLPSSASALLTAMVNISKKTIE